MNPLLQELQPYPFERLRELFADLHGADGLDPVALSIGEPQHEPPQIVLEALAANLGQVARYPTTRGLPALRAAIADWLARRYRLATIDPDAQVLPVNGTREALFAFAQTVVEPKPGALVMCPNPFYQIYEGAALLAGAGLRYLNCIPETGFAPDFESVSNQEWQHCQLLYLCNPGNPTGTVLPLALLKRLIALAREHDFVIASDECYAEIFPDETSPPPGLLQACAELGDDDYRHCVVFHSLSKRSNLPGLRSGFVAGDAQLLAEFVRYRTYHGSAMPLHHQLASIVAWNDEEHVRANRAQYREKFAAVLDLLAGHIDVRAPDAGFYLWPETPVADTEFARRLYADQHVTVLPGRYLARHAHGINPGENRVRMALVAPTAQCTQAARRIVRCLQEIRG
jgi:N-succinyldiaminopimelate aminotransferase